MSAAILIAVVIGATLCGCRGKQAASPAADGDVLHASSGSLDDTVTVHLGQRAYTRDRSLQLMYVRLVSESRCPANAICVWQGDAAVQLRGTAVGASVETTIHTALEPKVFEVGSNRISLLEVKPYPGTADNRQTYIVVRIVRDRP